MKKENLEIKFKTNDFVGKYIYYQDTGKDAIQKSYMHVTDYVKNSSCIVGELFSWCYIGGKLNHIIYMPNTKQPITDNTFALPTELYVNNITEITEEMYNTQIKKAVEIISNKK